jgi:Bacterial SH3 domain/YMGG-like Gly-zipper
MRGEILARTGVAPEALGREWEDRTMRRRRFGISALILIFLNHALGGCAGMSEDQKGGTIGAGVGAALGAVTGALVDKKSPGRGAALGAAAGAVVGGAAGWIVGQYKMRDVKTREQAAADLGYTSEQGVLTKMEGTSTTPQQLRPGGEVTVQNRYSVLAPPKGADVKVRESHSVFFANEMVNDLQRELTLTQGTKEVEFQMTLPPTAAEGQYTVLTTVEPLAPSGGKRAQSTSSFHVSAAAPASAGAVATPAAAVPIAITPPPPGSMPRLVPEALYVRNAAAHIREGAGAGFRIVTTARQGSRLQVLEEGGTPTDRWYRVRLPNGREGWVAASVVSPTP